MPKLQAIFWLTCVGTNLMAQESRAVRPQGVVGLAAATYGTSHPEGGPLGLGLVLGATGRTPHRLWLRGTVTAFQTVVTGDDIALCHPTSGGGCLQDSAFPSWLVTLNGDGVLGLRDDRRLSLVLGIGAVVGGAGRENRRAGARVSSGGKVAAAARAGLELALGRRGRAPRLQLTRVMLDHDMNSLSHLVSLTLLLPR